MTEVDFYFDFDCPWSFVALTRLQDVCERNRARMRLKPVVVSRILATENPERAGNPLAANPAKAAWQLKDLRDWARFWGLSITLADDWPRDRPLIAAASLAAIDAGKGIPFCLAALRAAFGAGADLDTPELIRSLAAETGLDPVIVLEASRSRGAEVAANEQELIRRGGFGTPSTFVDDALFFGNDRIPLVDWVLGPIGDDDFVIPGQHNG